MSTLQPRGRRVLVVVLLVVGSIVALLANLAVWSRNFAYDSDAFVDALAPLASDREVVDGVADELVDRVMDLQGGDNATLRSLLDGTLRKVLESPQFETIFTAAVRVAHEQLVELAGGDRQQVVLDLDDVLVRVDSLLQGVGRDILTGGQIEKIDDIVVKTRGRLDTALKVVDAVERGAIVLPVLALTLFGVALALATDRRRTLARIGVGLAVAMVATVGLVWVGRLDATHRVAGVYRRAVENVWDAVAESLYHQTAWVFGAGVVLAVGAWIVGRLRPAGPLGSGRD